jgi:hypothetical protein
MSEEEGSICGECKTRIGPMGCCATIRGLHEKLESVTMWARQVAETAQRLLNEEGPGERKAPERKYTPVKRS